MKKLSIEQKAQRYDEILVKLQEAKVDNDVCDERYCCVIDNIVPELKESEDERIRKAIIEIVKKDEERIGVNAHLKKIQWLEKQGEQKPANWFQELEDKLANATPKQLAEWKEKYFKEEPAEWSEESIATISRAISIVKWAAYSNHSHPILNDEGATELVERLKSLKDRYAWRPSDEQINNK